MVYRYKYGIIGYIISLRYKFWIYLCLFQASLLGTLRKEKNIYIQLSLLISLAFTNEHKHFRGHYYSYLHFYSTLTFVLLKFWGFNFIIIIAVFQMPVYVDYCQVRLIITSPGLWCTTDSGIQLRPESFTSCGWFIAYIIQEKLTLEKTTENRTHIIQYFVFSIYFEVTSSNLTFLHLFYNNKNNHFFSPIMRRNVIV